MMKGQGGGGAQSGFLEGSALQKFSSGRWLDTLTQIKKELEGATQEIKGYRNLSEDYHSKTQAHVAEMQAMEQAVADLQNEFKYVQEQYETELNRLRDKVMTQTGNKPAALSTLGGPPMQEEPSAERRSLPAISLSFPMSQGAAMEQPLKKLHVDASLGGVPATHSSKSTPSALGGSNIVPASGMRSDPGRLPGVPDAGRMPGMSDAGRMPGMSDAGRMPGMSDAGRMPGMPDAGRMPGMSDAGRMPSVSSLGQGAGLGRAAPLRDTKPADDNSAHNFASQEIAAREAAMSGQSRPPPVQVPAQQENDYNVVQGTNATNGDLLNMNVKLQNSFAHDSVVCCVRYSWDGDYIATGSHRCAQIFNASSGELAARFSREDTAAGVPESWDGYIRAVCFSPDGSSLITGSEDCHIRVWDIRSRTVKFRLAGHDRDIYAVEASKDGRYVVSGSGDKTTKIWQLQSGKLYRTLGGGIKAPNDGITSVSISSSGSKVAAGSLDRMVRVWDVETGLLLRSFEGHTDSVYSVAFSPDSQTLLSGSLDKTLKLWDLRDNSMSNQCKLSFVGHKDFVLSVAFSPNGRLLLSGSKDHTVQFWDPRQPSMCLMLQGHKNSVISIAHSPTNKMFATGSGDNRARTWMYTN